MFYANKKTLKYPLLTLNFTYINYVLQSSQNFFPLSLFVILLTFLDQQLVFQFSETKIKKFDI